MKRLAAVAFALAIALPACAQRGGSHAGFAGRSAPSFHSSFAPSASYRYAGSRPYAYASSARAISPGGRYASAISTARPAFYQRNGVSPDRRRFYRNRGVGLYSYPVVIGPGYWPYDGDLFDYDEPYDDLSAYGPEAPPPDVDNGYPEPPPQYEPPYAPAPEPPAPAVAPEMQYAPSSSDTVTLIFKDGRPPQQIQNYLATRTTLTVINGAHHHDIPLADLDLAATIKANRDTGVGFQLPTGQ